MLAAIKIKLKELAPVLVIKKLVLFLYSLFFSLYSLPYLCLKGKGFHNQNALCHGFTVTCLYLHLSANTYFIMSGQCHTCYCLGQSVSCKFHQLSRMEKETRIAVICGDCVSCSLPLDQQPPQIMNDCKYMDWLVGWEFFIFWLFSLVH